jgi:hypothetical protein
MTPYFADAYYFFALLNARDEAHAQALGFNARLRRPLVTTEWILIEVADGLAATPSRKLFTILRRQLAADSRVTLVGATPEIFDRGAALYESRPDKDWSLTDCISFVVMKDLGITEALTADRHFEQAGFAALLKQSC